MAVIVVIFYPMFIKLEQWVKKLSSKFIRTGKNVAGKYIGLFLAFFLAISVLFYFYSKMWYDIDFIRVLFQGKIGNYL